MRVTGGKTHYGQAIGVLTPEGTRFPRIAGDAGNAESYEFPVKLKAVKGANVRRIIKEADPTLADAFIKAAKELEEEGVSAITTSCGFCSMYQEEMAKQLKVPVFTSALMVVPMVQRMLGRNQKVGIVTADGIALGEKHLKGVGIDPSSVVIEGLEKASEFVHGILEDNLSFDPGKVEEEVVEAAKRLTKRSPNIGAIVFECANLAPYAGAVHNAVGLPVFDIIQFASFVHDSVVFRNRFEGLHL